MKFLKEQAFLVATGAVTLLGVVVLAVLTHSANARIRQYVEKRTSLSARLAGLSRDRINRNKVLSAKQRVEDMKRMRQQVEDWCLAVNRRDYQVLTFDIGNRKGVPAFPVGEDTAERATLRLLFPEEYQMHLAALRDTLRPTWAPTEPDVRKEQERMTEAGAGTPTPTPIPTPHLPYVPGIPRPLPYLPGTPRTYTPGGPGETTTTGPAPPSAQELAERKLVLQRAQGGRVYVDDTSLYMPLTAQVHYGDDELWMAQVALWVQKDIVDAVNRTIAEMERSGARVTEKGVPASAVKRLMDTRIRGYVMKGSAGPGGGLPTGLPPAVVGPGGTPSPSGGGTGGATESGPRLQYLSFGPTSGTPGAGGGTGEVPLLTGRACNPLYDVLHYEFTVIMPAEHLLSLYRNLLLQNYHTILNVSVGTVGEAQQPGTGMSGVARTAARAGYYYYGTDAVVEATIVGEMLLLADFTRGRAQPDKKGFVKDYPPLMPVRFLERMSQMDSSALRPEDQERARASGAARTPPPTGGMPGPPPPMVLPRPPT